MLKCILFKKTAPNRVFKEQYNIAFFSAYLPPFESGGVHRLIPLIKEFEESENQCTYFCRRHPRIGNLSDSEKFMLSLLPESATVIESETNDYKCINVLTPSIDAGVQSGLAAYKNALKKGLQSDLVFASGPSFNFVYGAYLHARKSNIPLIIDYRDEWTDCPFDFVKQTRFSRAVERAVCDYADKIIMTTQAMIDKHKSSFGHPDVKYELIHNGWDESLANVEEPANLTNSVLNDIVEAKKNKLVMLYTGTLGVATPPFEFLNYIAGQLSKDELNEIVIIFIGHVDRRYKATLDDYKAKLDIRIYPQVEKNVAIAALKLADLLLLFTNKNMERYLPGKLFDYLSSGNQILNFGKDGEASKIIKQLKAGLFVETDASLTLPELRQLIQAKYSENAKKWLEEHKRKALSKKIKDTICGV